MGRAMPTSMAHMLEPALGGLGGVLAACTLVRPPRSAAAALSARAPQRALRTVLAFGLLRIG